MKSLLFTALLVFKAKAWGFWGFVFLVQDQWAGEPDVELRILAPVGESLQHSGGMGFHYITSLSLLPPLIVVPSLGL